MAQQESLESIEAQVLDAESLITFFDRCIAFNQRKLEFQESILMNKWLASDSKDDQSYDEFKSQYMNSDIQVHSSELANYSLLESDENSICDFLDQHTMYEVPDIFHICGLQRTIDEINLNQSYISEKREEYSTLLKERERWIVREDLAMLHELDEYHMMLDRRDPMCDAIEEEVREEEFRTRFFEELRVPVFICEVVQYIYLKCYLLY